jgi:hypothetical protein
MVQGLYNGTNIFYFVENKDIHSRLSVMKGEAGKPSELYKSVLWGYQPRHTGQMRDD